MRPGPFPLMVSKCCTSATSRLNVPAYSALQTAGGRMTRKMIADAIVRTARSIDARSLDVAFADAEGLQHTVSINSESAASRALGSVRTFGQGLMFGLVLLLMLPLMVLVALAAAALENEELRELKK